jgi:hypothetical protein
MASNLNDKVPLKRTVPQHLLYGGQYITNAEDVKDFFHFLGDLSKKLGTGEYLAVADGSRWDHQLEAARAIC